MNNEENKVINKEQENKKKSWFKDSKYIINFLLICFALTITYCIFDNFFNSKDIVVNSKKIDSVQKEKIDRGRWIIVNSQMSKIRQPATANLLPDGNVLIMGGQDKSADTADIFDPKQMKIVKTIKLDDKRYYDYVSESLPNGNVLIAGGYLFDTMPPNITNTAKIFNSREYIFENIESMKFPHHIGVKLGNGQVLLMNNIINPGAVGRENMRFQVYDSKTNSYFEVKNMIHKMKVVENEFMTLENNNILLSCYAPYPNDKDRSWASICIYDIKENKFKKYHKQIPIGYFFIPLDKNSYLNLQPTDEYTSGYIYYIKEDKKIPVKNNIPRTVRPGNQPIFVTLKNGNVLIMGINVVEMRQETNAIKKYSSFLYDREKNMFFQIPNPPYPMSKPGIVMLPNGDILFAGGRSDRNGNKIQIYRYKH